MKWLIIKFSSTAFTRRSKTSFVTDFAEQWMGNQEFARGISTAVQMSCLVVVRCLLVAAKFLDALVRSFISFGMLLRRFEEWRIFSVSHSRLCQRCRFLLCRHRRRRLLNRASTRSRERCALRGRKYSSENKRFPSWHLRPKARPRHARSSLDYSKKRVIKSAVNRGSETVVHR